MKVSGNIVIVFLCYAVSLGICSDPETNELHDTAVSEKKSRLISFNNDHGEVKIELDFAVPFMNIPVKPKRIGGHSEIEPLLEINTKGLLTVGSIIFLLVTVVPKIVKIFIPQAHATVTDGIMPLMSRLDEALHSMNIPSLECYQRSACWIGSSTPITSSALNNFSSPDWLKRVIENPEIQEALNRGKNGDDCSVYKCSIPMQTIGRLMNIGKGMLSSEN